MDPREVTHVASNTKCFHPRDSKRDTNKLELILLEVKVMLKRSHTNQSQNAIMYINNPVSFEFFVTKAQRTSKIFLNTRYGNSSPKLEVVLRGNILLIANLGL